MARKPPHPPPEKADPGGREQARVPPVAQARGERAGTIDRFTRDRLGAALRGMYPDLLKQPIPRHLARLVKRPDS